MFFILQRRLGIQYKNVMCTKHSKVAEHKKQIELVLTLVCRASRE